MNHGQQTQHVVPAERTSSHRQLSQWQHAIVAGNRAFDAQDYDSAHRAYLYGLSLAKSLLRDTSIADNAIAALVTTCHNLADLHQASGKLNLAADQLCTIHRQLMHLAESGTLHSAALHHQRRTQLELMRFIAEHPQYEYLLSTLGMPAPAAVRH